MRRFSFVFLSTFAFFTPCVAQTTLNAYRPWDLKPLVGSLEQWCYGNPAFDAFKKSLYPSFPIDVNRKIEIVAPGTLANILQKPNVVDKGDHTEFVVPVVSGHLNGVRVTYLIVAVGNENGIHLEGIEFDATKAEVQAKFKNELQALRKRIKKDEKSNDGQPPTLGVKDNQGKAQIICNTSM